VHALSLRGWPSTPTARAHGVGGPRRVGNPRRVRLEGGETSSAGARRTVWDFEADSPFANVRRVTGTPGLSFAWALAPSLGLVVESRYIWARRVADEQSPLVRQWVSTGAALDFDLNPLIRFPLGILAEASGEEGRPAERGPDA
jgi:hypothetical protein